eukprot:851612-Amphidinium_carterae.1
MACMCMLSSESQQFGTTKKTVCHQGEMARWVKVKGGDDPIRCDLSTSDRVFDLLMLVKTTLSPALDTVRVDQMK